MIQQKRFLLSVVAVTVAAGLFTGCSPSSDTATSEPFTGGDTSVVDKSAGNEVPSGIVAGTESSSDIGTDITDSARDVITTGALGLVSDDPTQVASEIRSIVTTAGGRVESQEETPENEYQTSSARLTVKVPADEFEDTITVIKKLGTVESFNTSSTDVTEQVKDYEVRERVLQGSINRLLTLMSTATDTNTLLSIETTLSQRESELESLRAAQKNIEEQVSFSTLSVTIQQPVDVKQPEPRGFLDGLTAGWEGLVAVTTGIVIGVGFLVPWVVVGSVLGGIGWLIFRKRRKTKQSAQTKTENPAPDSDQVNPTQE